VQRVVHVRAGRSSVRQSAHPALSTHARQRHRLRGDRLILPRLPADAARSRERLPRVFQHHPHHASLQADASLARAQDPHTHVQGERARTDAARLLSRPRYRHLCVTRLLRRAHPVQSNQRLHLHPGPSSPRTSVSCEAATRRTSIPVGLWWAVGMEVR